MTGMPCHSKGQGCSEMTLLKELKLDKTAVFKHFNDNHKDMTMVFFDNIIKIVHL